MQITSISQTQASSEYIQITVNEYGDRFIAGGVDTADADFEKNIGKLHIG